MSIIKVKNIQIGQDVDPNKNFTVLVPASPDGSLEIRRGNASAPGTLLAKINADGGVNTGAPAFSAYASAATSLVQNVATKVGFQTEDYDTANCYDTTLSRFTPNVAGYYHFDALVNVATTQTLVISILYKNGAEFKRGNAATGMSSSSLSCMVFMNGTTDYVELFANQAAATQNATAASSLTYFQGFLVRAA